MSDDTKLVADNSGDDTSVLSIFDICETDTTAEEEGRWFRDIFNDGTNIDIKLRRMTSKKSMQVRRRLDKGYRRYLRNGVYPDDIAVKVLIEHLAEGVLIDWKNIRDRDKKEMPYSKETAIALLTKLTVFRDGILGLAQSLDAFRVEEQEEAVKN